MGKESEQTPTRLCISSPVQGVVSEAKNEGVKESWRFLQCNGAEALLYSKDMQLRLTTEAMLSRD
jgi:hypothetical protein